MWLTLRSARGNVASLLSLRWAHSTARPAPLDGIMTIHCSITSPPWVFPEFDPPSVDDSNNFGNIGFGFPSFSSDGSMELMAVPKRKVSPHKRGIRNGPKALKPTPVIIRCKSCGRVKLPHFYCCSGDGGNSKYWRARWFHKMSKSSAAYKSKNLIVLFVEQEISNIIEIVLILC
ncbi:uncharacterized protein LOC21402981 [Morus notabilis]|nr:uncharacterized protein LOC21402981 [Morus notabilis]XP_024023647.1 uncharacterized protein LOC21402981 [Morus notabilis]